MWCKGSFCCASIKKTHTINTYMSHAGNSPLFSPQHQCLITSVLSFLISLYICPYVYNYPQERCVRCRELGNWRMSKVVDFQKLAFDWRNQKFSQNEQTTNKSHKYATPIKIRFCVLKEAPHPSHKRETQTWCRVNRRTVFTFGSNETISAFRTHTRRNKKIFFTLVLSVSYLKIMHQLVLHGASKSHF